MVSLTLSSLLWFCLAEKVFGVPLSTLYLARRRVMLRRASMRSLNPGANKRLSMDDISVSPSSSSSTPPMTPHSAQHAAKDGLRASAFAFIFRWRSYLFSSIAANTNLIILCLFVLP
jgi:hypothetical protein